MSNEIDIQSIFEEMRAAWGPDSVSLDEDGERLYFTTVDENEYYYCVNGAAGTIQCCREVPQLTQASSATHETDLLQKINDVNLMLSHGLGISAHVHIHHHKPFLFDSAPLPADQPAGEVCANQVMRFTDVARALDEHLAAQSSPALPAALASRA